MPKLQAFEKLPGTQVYKFEGRPYIAATANGKDMQVSPGQMVFVDEKERIITAVSIGIFRKLFHIVEPVEETV